CSHRTEHTFGLSSQGHELRGHASLPNGQDDHRVDWSGAALGRRSRIEHPEVLEALHLRHVRVPVDDRLAVGEPRRKASLPALPRPRVVDHPDPRTLHLDDVLAGKQSPQRRLVHVPLDSLDRRAESTQLFEERGRDEVAAVQDQVGAPQPPDTLVRKRPRPAREVRVRDDGNPRRVGRYTRTSFPTRNVFVKVVTRSGFVWARTRTVTRYVPAFSGGSLKSTEPSGFVPAAEVTVRPPRCTLTLYAKPSLTERTNDRRSPVKFARAPTTLVVCAQVRTVPW